MEIVVSTESNLVELVEMVQTRMPVFENHVEVNLVHCYLFNEFGVVLEVVYFSSASFINFF
jgi:hypothetical protein